MKIVIDTNVFVSSFFDGNPRAVIDLWKQGQITLCLSRKIIDEYFEVLQRIGLKEENELEELLSLLARGFNSVFTTITPCLRIVDDDPDDDKFFECAVALKAQYIISGDKEVLEIDNYFGIKVVTPKQFLEIFNQLSVTKNL